MSDDDHKLMKEQGHWHHTGADDRRKAERRSGRDQREMIRFEPDKEDRRSAKDRRKSATHWGTDKPI